MKESKKLRIFKKKYKINVLEKFWKNIKNCKSLKYSCGRVTRPFLREPLEF